MRGARYDAGATCVQASLPWCVPRVLTLAVIGGLGLIVRGYPQGMRKKEVSLSCVREIRSIPLVWFGR